MARRTYKIPGFPIDIPLERLWESERENWEGDIGEDPIGDDLDARLWAVRQAIKSGHAPTDASSTLIARDDIAGLIRPLRLNDAAPTVDRLWRIAGRHLRPRHMEILGSDPKAIAELLDQVRRSIIQLEGALDRIPPVVRDFLTEVFPMLPRPYRNNEKLDLVATERALPDLGHVVFLVGDALTRRRRRPPKILRRQTLVDAAATIEAGTGNGIKTRWSEKGETCFKFRGDEGQALLAFMKLVEPTVSEMALVKDFRALRKQTTKISTPNK
jgi:hypothetical protein